ncbi:MAG: FG-GAP repeat protein, partial [Limisphaerales bacterium]
IKFRSVAFGQIAGTYSVEVGDLNGDKFPDIVVGNSGAHNFIYFNQGKQGKAGEVLPGKRIALNH